MSCQIVFTDTAKTDLREITISLAELTKDRDLTIRFVQGLRKATEILKEFSESGSIPRDRVLKSNGFRFLTCKDYLIFYLYEKEANTVYIMAVFNGKRDYMRVMKKFL